MVRRLPQPTAPEIEPHIPIPEDEPPPPFEAAEFLGYIDTGFAKFNRQGQLGFGLVVTREYLQSALPVIQLAANPVPLHVRLEVWAPYAQQVADDVEPLRARMRVSRGFVAHTR
jgi:hypothetical protein